MEVSEHRQLVLDTSAYSGFRRGHPAALDLVASAAVITVPVVVIGELEAGFEVGRRTAENRLVLAEFLAEPGVEILEATRRTARLYARVFAALRAAGTPIPINDVWIAAATMECGGHLLTLDRDFERVPNLEHTLLMT